MFYRYFLRRLYVCFFIFFQQKNTPFFELQTFEPASSRSGVLSSRIDLRIIFPPGTRYEYIKKMTNKNSFKARFLEFHRFPRSGGSKLLSTHNFLIWSFFGPDSGGLLHQNLRLDFFGTPPQNPFMKLCEQEHPEIFCDFLRRTVSLWLPLSPLDRSICRSRNEKKTNGQVVVVFWETRVKQIFDRWPQPKQRLTNPSLSLYICHGIFWSNVT